MSLLHTFRACAIKTFFVESGLAAFSRARRPTAATILTFHGLCEDMAGPDNLECYLHLPVNVFHSICALLSRKFRVVALADLIAAHARGDSLPPNAVVITFDDGYASNYELAYPILRQFALPATIFPASGFLDGKDMMWFQRVDLAMSRTSKQRIDWTINGSKRCLLFGSHRQRQQSFMGLMPELKKLSNTDLLHEVSRLEDALGVKTPGVDDLPRQMRPMNWDMAREMAASGQIEIGGHTHTHPILARCDSSVMREEIFTCRDRIRDELGKPPACFAYPNGRPEDFTQETTRLVKEAGFKGACSMIDARVDACDSLFQLPRHAAPPSAWEADATVSGVFETLKEWGQRCRKAVSQA